MGKITIIIDDELEQRLRKYIFKRYEAKWYGKLSEVIEEAVKEHLDRRG